MALLLTSAPVEMAGAQDPVQPARPTIVPATPGKMQRITLQDGSQILGRILSVGDTLVQFESALGTTNIPISSIVSVREEAPGEVRQGRYYFPNPNATRLIFAPTGRMLAKGEGYFSDYLIFFPGLAVGASDMFSIGGGISVLPGVDLDQQLFYVTPKVGVLQTPKFNAAVGALYIALPGDFDEGGAGDNSAGVLYGVGTWGRPDQSFTAGLGYGFHGGDLADRPMVMLGGEARASPRISFVTENYSFPGGTIWISGGIRFMGRDTSVDFAIAKSVATDEEGFWFPFLGVVWKW